MTQITETVEQYEYRRRQEVQDAAVAKAESNKILNKARQLAKFGRFGINRELPRSQEALAIIAAEEKRVLGISVEPATNIVRQPKPAEILAGNEGKQPENDGIDAVIGSFTPLANDVVESLGVDVAIPCIVDIQPCVVAITNYLGKCVVKTEREVINSMRTTQPFKDYVGSKSDLIKQTLSDMVIQGLLCSTLDDGKASYSLSV